MAALVILACEAQIEGVPEGALAVVGDQVIETGQLDATHAQLDAYGQARFRGEHGRRALLDAMIMEELLVYEAREAGLADDPRVQWAVLAELAQLQRAAMLERRLPRADVAADTEALRARYAAERERFFAPERRRLRVVRVATYDAGERAIAQLLAGELTLEELAGQLPGPTAGQIVQTPLMKRDDQEFPAYHAIVFDPALKVGDVAPRPLLSGQLVLVGIVDAIEPARTLGFDDPQVQEQLLIAEWEARVPEVEATLLAELRERFPAQ
jgi:hypothetical protein